MAEPKCPECGVEGIEHIHSKESVEHGKDKSPWFQVAFCHQCGHIYGVFAKHTFSSGKSGPQLVFNR